MGLISLTLLAEFLEFIVANAVLKSFINDVASNGISFKKGFYYGTPYIILTNIALLFYVLIRKIEFPAMFKMKEDIKNFIFANSLKQSNSFFNDNFVGVLNSKINDIMQGMEKIIDDIGRVISNFTIFFIL